MIQSVHLKNIDLEGRTMAEFLDRALYRKIKGMNRKALESLIQEFYNMGKESAEKPDVDMEALKVEISAIKGIGATRQDEILKAVQRHLCPSEKTVE